MCLVPVFAQMREAPEFDLPVVFHFDGSHVTLADSEEHYLAVLLVEVELDQEELEVKPEKGII